MKILAFESSAKAASTALLSDGLLLAEYTQNSGQTHSRTLMQMAKDMLTSCDLNSEDKSLSQMALVTIYWGDVDTGRSMI